MPPPSHPLPRHALAVALCVAASHAAAADTRTAIERLLHQESQGLPGRVQVTLPAATELPACAEPQPFLPTGARAWGRVSVGVRCAGAAPWTRYVSAYVAVIASYQVAARGIAPGEALHEGDASAREGDLAALPAGVVTDAAELGGKVAMNHIAAGAPLRRELLRGALLVRQGQQVRVVVRGPGFSAGVDGRAMNDAAVGATVQVKANNGRLIFGVVREDGSVEHAL